MAKGNHETRYYVCANINYDLGCYDSEFKKNDIAPILYGHGFFADFAHLQSPDLSGCIVEIHGLGLGWANVGIYTDDLSSVPDDVQISMIFKHIGDACFERVS